jgi:hypothetical protein
VKFLAHPISIASSTNPLLLIQLFLSRTIPSVSPSPDFIIYSYSFIIIKRSRRNMFDPPSKQLHKTILTRTKQIIP